MFLESPVSLHFLKSVEWARHITWSITAKGFPGYRGVGGMRGSTETSYIQARVNNHRYRKSNVHNTALLVLYTYILTFCN